MNKIERMSTVRNFEELMVWQKARQLCKEIFEITDQYNFSKDFGLKNQLNRSAGSIMDNIAEGFGRAGNGEFANFLTIARGSAFEVRSQLYRALDRNYIDEKKCSSLFSILDEIIKMIASLIQYLNRNITRAFRNRTKDQKQQGSANPNAEL